MTNTNKFPIQEFFVVGMSYKNYRDDNENNIYLYKQEKIMPKLTVKVDHDACSGIGSCIETSARFFKFDDENRAIVISNETGIAKAEQILEVSDAEAQEILSAAESCPMVAISVFDETGSQLYG
jgi:ferredoxin